MRKKFLFVVVLMAVCLLSSHAYSQPVVKLLATGGTIAMKIDPVKKTPVPAISGEDLLALVPDIAKYAKIEVENPFNIPSDYMDPDKWIKIQKLVTAALERPEVAGIVVSHGTDTLEETAFFLDLTVKNSKPIVLTAAMRPASDPDFDGPRNLLNAVKICVSPEARDKGVMIALNGQINAAREATKTSSLSVETFKSGDHGFLGHVDFDKVYFYRSPLRRQYIPLTSEKLPDINIVPMYTGADGSMIKAAIDHGAKGIVVIAMGAGNVNIPMYEAIKNAIDKGIQVVISSRVPTGRTRPQYYSFMVGGGMSLAKIGAILADDLNPQKARILLMLLMQDPNIKSVNIQKHFFE